MSEKSYVQFDGMCWPAPGKRLDELEHSLRYGGNNGPDALLIASYLSAYRELVSCPKRKREHVIRQIWRRV
jgi:hypothetical protein